MQNGVIVDHRVGNHTVRIESFIKIFYIFHGEVSDCQMASGRKIPPNLTVNHGMVTFDGVLLQILLYLFEIGAHIFKDRNI